MSETTMIIKLFFRSTVLREPNDDVAAT